MLDTVLGSQNLERVLIFILARNEGYAREIAEYYQSSLSPIQKQLEKMENGGILASRSIGRTRLYNFNPRYPFLDELKSLLEKAFSFYPPEEIENLRFNRKRPRQTAKPL